ncbi:MAG: orotate phosphoribosyltransferase [Spirochaetaceae bacterium]|nr:orotate phosphoribosyltransferase [Spirochaetaceae bacterium]
MTSVSDILLNCDAMLEGHFLLSSGRHSNRYFQCARLFQFPDKAALALENVVKTLKKEIEEGRLHIDYVCGPAIGGIIAAYEVARQLGLPAIFTERNEEGAMSLRRGFSLKPGDKVLLAEDVVTTGKSSGEAALALKACGAEIVAEACVVNRSGKEQPLDWPLYPACTIEAQTWDAKDCPLCKAGSTAIKPGSRKM